MRSLEFNLTDQFSLPYSTGEWIVCSSQPTLMDPAVSNIYSFVDLRCGDMNVFRSVASMCLMISCVFLSVHPCALVTVLKLNYSNSEMKDFEIALPTFSEIYKFKIYNTD